jgi:gas vesicle protein
MGFLIGVIVGACTMVIFYDNKVEKLATAKAKAAVEKVMDEKFSYVNDIADATAAHIVIKIQEKLNGTKSS